MRNISELGEFEKGNEEEEEEEMWGKRLTRNIGLHFFFNSTYRLANITTKLA